MYTIHINYIYHNLYGVGFAGAINSGIFQSRDFKGWAVNILCLGYRPSATLKDRTKPSSHVS
jgi:hypothetical protein